jgi:hypothetical protein
MDSALFISLAHSLIDRPMTSSFQFQVVSLGRVPILGDEVPDDVLHGDRNEID